MSFSPKQLGKVLAMGNMTNGPFAIPGTMEQLRLLTIAQTTPNQTVSMPNPSDASTLFALDVLNTGTVSIVLNGVTVPAQTEVRFAWTSTGWIAAAVASPMTGATAVVSGTGGTVPAPVFGQQGQFLRGDGSWGTAGAGMALYGQSLAATTVTPTGTSFTSALTFMTINIPAAGTYEITFSVRGLTFTQMSGMSAGLYTGAATAVGSLVTGTFVPNSTMLVFYEATGNNYFHCLSTMSLIVTPTAATTYTVGVWQYAGAGGIAEASDTNGSSVISYVQVGTSAITAMTGATAGAAGAGGFVPAPAAGQQTLVLSGAGTWITPPGVAMTGATSGSAGTAGTVPAPIAGQQGQFLVGSGAWAPNSVGQIALSGTTYAPNGNTVLNAANNSSALAITYFTVTIPAAGTWELTYSVRGYLAGTGCALYVGAPTATGAAVTATLVPNSEIGILDASGSTFGIFTTATGVQIITTTAATVYTIGVWGNAASTIVKSDAMGRSSATYIQLGSAATSVFGGATSGLPGTAGYVPAPTAGQQAMVLSGAGTWVAPSAATMTGATSGSAGTGGSVPAPIAGQQGQFLTGSGAWAPNSAGQIALNGSVTSPLALSTTGSTPATALTYMTITIPAAGVWEITSIVRGSGINNTGLTFGLFLGAATAVGSVVTASLLANSEVATAFMSATPTAYVTATGVYMLTTTASAIVTVGIWADSSTGSQAVSDSGGRSSVQYLQIGSVATSTFGAATAGAAGTGGFVPPPLAGQQASVLTGAGTWVVPSVATMTGATATVVGVGGTVPAPPANTVFSALNGDGTWRSTERTYNPGNPPATAVSTDLYDVMLIGPSALSTLKLAYPTDTTTGRTIRVINNGSFPLIVASPTGTVIGIVPTGDGCPFHCMAIAQQWFCLGQPSVNAKIAATASQSFVAGSTAGINLPSIVANRGLAVSGNTITVPVTALYKITARMAWDQSANGGTRVAMVLGGGAVILRDDVVPVATSGNWPLAMLLCDNQYIAAGTVLTMNGSTTAASNTGVPGGTGYGTSLAVEFISL